MKNGIGGQHLIFGYGSLANAESREATGISSFVCAAKVKGLRRGWNVRTSRATALGVTDDPAASCNGVIVSVDDEGLARFDERELPALYRRVAIAPDRVEFLDGERRPGPVWAYVARDPKASDDSRPILQSYIDVVLTGFLELGDRAAEEFVETTDGWSHIFDDRGQPLYSRPLKRLDRKADIDRLLERAKEAC